MCQHTSTVEAKKYHGCVYRVTNMINSKVYYGQTISDPPILRWKHHVREATVKKSNIKFHLALRKYGVENFKFEIVSYASSREELDKLEASFIDPVLTENPDMTYNIKFGGSSRGTAELGKRISEGKLRAIAIKGKPVFEHPTKFRCTREVFESLVRENLKIRQIGERLGYNPGAVLLWARREYGLHTFIQIRSTILGIEVNEAKLTYKPFDRGKFLQLIKQGVCFQHMPEIFNQDLSSLKRKWRRWYPDCDFKDLKYNIDKLIAEYETDPRSRGNFIYEQKTL
jgi:group I intron endonuclease